LSFSKLPIPFKKAIGRITLTVKKTLAGIDRTTIRTEKEKNVIARNVVASQFQRV
jgi:hypothetical protein